MSEIKVNKISPRTNCGTTQLGDSGDTITIPAGVSITNSGTASGFGATGAVSWETTVKTSNFTATAGEGYFVNTTGGAVSVNLPAGTAGAVVGIKDYANTFDSNAVTLVQNGSDKIGGSTVNSTLDTEGIAITLVFIDSTQGWLVTDSGLQSEAPTATFITATGGTITTSGDFKIHTFTGPGTFTVCSVGNPSGSNTVDYMVVAGGGGGAQSRGGGGGAGGYRESSGAASGCYTASPLGSGVSALPVSAQGYPITVGGGGAGGDFSATPPSVNGMGTTGSASSFSTISSAGGGGASPGCANSPPFGPATAQRTGKNGGSGGGGGSGNSDGGAGGTGNTPPVSPAQGTDGGSAGGSNNRSGGGGGATVAGASGTGFSPDTGNGGTGATNNITGVSVSRAGGGGGGSGNTPAAGSGGTGGGGAGSVSGAGTNGTDNTGGGGGGGGSNSGQDGGAGGSGVVVIRYKFQ